MSRALGLVETKGLVAAIEAADAMLKAANVSFAGKDVTNPALITIKVIGDTAAVKAAVEAGAVAAGRIGQLVSTHIIPQPDDQLSTMLPEISDSKSEYEKSEVSKNKSSIERDEEQHTKNINSKKQFEDRPKKTISKKKLDRKRRNEKENESENASDTIARLRKEALAREIEQIEEIPEKDNIDKDIEKLNVHELRRLARSTPSFPIKGREISRANREELLNHFKNLR
ncbi:MAG TPA: BMC domain-containing protein [Ignavibacteriaceae bacterium]|nr:BMC domain-containing protein [Ignavibacteriaceae bacterium]